MTPFPGFPYRDLKSILFGCRSLSGDPAEGPSLRVIASPLIEETKKGSQFPGGVKSGNGPVVEIHYLAVYIMPGTSLGIDQRKAQFNGIIRRRLQGGQRIFPAAKLRIPVIPAGAIEITEGFF